METLNRKYFAADDWGLTPGVNAGILALARRGLLRSVSLMANGSHLRDGLEELLSFRDLKFSLHLNFTQGRPLSGGLRSLVTPTGEFYPHGKLIWKSLTGRLSTAEIRREFVAQLKYLKSQLVPISMVDGHHHIHLLPGIVGPLHGALVAEGIHNVRVVCDPEHRPSYFQALLYRGVLARPGLALEACHYLRKRHLRSREAFHRKLARHPATPLLVHPALYNDFANVGIIDSLQEERVAELHSVLGYLDA